MEFFNDDGTALDGALFDDDRSTAPNNFFRTLYNEDENLASSYPIRYRVFHTNYDTNVAEQMDAFTINIITDCSNPVFITESAPVDQEYTITDTAKTYQIPAFTWAPPFCPITYSHTVMSPAADSAISFDSGQAVRRFTFFN